jgi:hypothetical protein
MKRKIFIDGLHWDNILQLPCVRGLNKRSDNEIVVKSKLLKDLTFMPVLAMHSSRTRQAAGTSKERRQKND